MVEKCKSNLSTSRPEASGLELHGRRFQLWIDNCEKTLPIQNCMKMAESFISCCNGGTPSANVDATDVDMTP